jgi:hypothetical protein
MALFPMNIGAGGGTNGKIATGTFQTDTSSPTSVTGLGFRPKFVCVIYQSSASSSSGLGAYIYDENKSTTQVARFTSSGSNYSNMSSGTNQFTSIDDDGFTLGAQSYRYNRFFASDEPIDISNIF